MKMRVEILQKVRTFNVIVFFIETHSNQFIVSIANTSIEFLVVFPGTPCTSVPAKAGSMFLDSPI